MGRITNIDNTGQQITVEFDEHRRVEYPYALLGELELSYAITIHKAQGSEYPAVVLPLMGGPRLLMTRNLLYTAITRARNCVMILGSSDTVRDMIQNVSENRRYTAFADRIRELHKN
jgi:exodeoxyribonuclease V alpha subunit